MAFRFGLAIMGGEQLVVPWLKRARRMAGYSRPTPMRTTHVLFSSVTAQWFGSWLEVSAWLEIGPSIHGLPKLEILASPGFRWQGFQPICWYFTDSWEQFRINGIVDVIDGPCNRRKVPLAPSIVDVDFLLTLKGQRENSWFASSLRARMQYLGPDLDLPSVNEELPENTSLDPSVSPVDYLNRKTNTRQVFECSGSLNGDRCSTSGRINP
ncbi:hypothetical protein Cgig2_011609 [Carnegiea gigantea]|uniref:Uncharacterized protein n=1 Tax=Carnegiea gigantea TaxID=171969 RepID=A0A9Q1GI07_9CARY|nr:hypothetical protein Cgig2_011609 [Carnegiea gigantea]